MFYWFEGDYMYNEALNDLTSDNLNEKYLKDKLQNSELKLNRMRKWYENDGYEKNGRYEIFCNFDFDFN
jgi:hypothetical protein